LKAEGWKEYPGLEARPRPTSLAGPGLEAEGLAAREYSLEAEGLEAEYGRRAARDWQEAQPTALAFRVLSLPEFPHPAAAAALPLAPFLHNPLLKIS
jgi:hypothetical protein